MSKGRYAQLSGRQPKRDSWKFKNFKKGANNFADANEIRRQEFYQAKNIELVGLGGVRLPRRGMDVVTEIAGITGFDGGAIFKNPVDNSNELLLMADGKVYEYTGSGSPTDVSGGNSWSTGYRFDSTLVRNALYFGNGQEYMSKWDGSSITQWNLISVVTNLSVSTVGSAGSTHYEYTVTAVTDSGETSACTNVSITNGNETLDDSNYNQLEWDRKSSSDVKGYNVYGRKPSGNGPMLLTFVDQPASGPVTFNDTGPNNYVVSEVFFPPEFNTTGGVKGSLFTDYKDTIITAGVDDNPDVLFYSGVQDHYETFSPAYGGGWIRVRAGDGDSITGLVNYEDYVIVFKDWSIHKFSFSGDGAPSTSSLLFGYGTKSPDSIRRVQNDVFYFGSDKKLRVLGYEPNILNMIRTAAISNRISDRLNAWTSSSLEDVHAVLYEQKYILCNGSEAYAYDRRYTAFLDKWTNFNFSKFLVWDGITGENQLYGLSNEDGKVYRVLKDNYYKDAGNVIEARVRTRSEDMDSFWRKKTWLWTEMRFKNVIGEIEISSVKDGETTVSEASISSASPAGIGFLMVGEGMVGEGGGSTPQESAKDAPRRMEYYQEARTFYWEIFVSSSGSRCVLQSMGGLVEVEDEDYIDTSRLIS